MALFLEDGLEPGASFLLRTILDRIRLTNRTYHFAAEFAELGG